MISNRNYLFFLSYGTQCLLETWPQKIDNANMVERAGKRWTLAKIHTTVLKHITI